MRERLVPVKMSNLNKLMQKFRDPAGRDLPWLWGTRGAGGARPRALARFTERWRGRTQWTAEDTREVIAAAATLTRTS